MSAVLLHPNVNRLIEEFGTPLQIIDLEQLRQNVYRFKSCFPDYTLYYSTKTNPNPAVIDIMIQEQLSFDAATTGEIKLLLDRGVDPARILFTHPIKSLSELTETNKLGVKLYTLDSLQELKKLEAKAADSAYFLRVRSIGNAGLYDYENKHGADQQETNQILDYAVQNKLNIVGLSFHVGSQTMSIKPWEDVLDYCRSLFDQYYDRLPSLRQLNIGSGFPGIYSYDPSLIPTLEQIAKSIHEHTRSFPEDVKFIAEPGRPLVATASTIIADVVDRVDRNDGSWIYTDISTYDGLVEINESHGKLTYPISALDDVAEMSYTVAGKTLDPDDILGRDVMLPSSCKANDKLAVHDVGAYSTSFYTNYHHTASPTLVYVDSAFDQDVMVGKSMVATYGVIAERDFQAGEKIFTISGYHSPTRTRTSFQVSQNGHLEPCVLGAYLNHSCDPNAGMRTNKLGLLDVIALKPIAAGNEVIVDYSMFEYELADMATVRCNCGSPVCRSHINGYRGLAADQRLKYSGFVAAHLTANA